MLVLSRKVGESIRIGDGITVVINRIAGNRVTLGLEAPRNMRIVRGELKLFDEPLEQPSEVREEKKAPVPSIESPPVTLELSSDSAFYLPRRAK